MPQTPELYTEEMVADLREPILANFHAPTYLKPSWHIRPDEMARAILDAAAPAIAAKALRDAIEKYDILISDESGFDIRVVYSEDLLDAAAEAERGFGK